MWVRLRHRWGCWFQGCTLTSKLIKYVQLFGGQPYLKKMVKNQTKTKQKNRNKSLGTSVHASLGLQPQLCTLS